MTAELCRNWLAALRMFLVVAGNTLVYHLFFVFGSTHMIEIQNLPASTAMVINTMNLVVLVIACALGGWLGDQYGRKKVYITRKG